MPTIKEAFAVNNKRYLANNPLQPVGVVLHSVGTPQPSAEVFVKMWQEDRSQYLTHYVLDGVDIYHTMPDDRKCYHVGSPGNGKWLGIEMCEPKQIKYTSGATFSVTDADAAKTYTKKCYDNAVLLLAMLCKQYGWNPHTAILTHNEVTRQKMSNTNHVDPEHLWKGLAMGYTLDTLRRDVSAAMGMQPEEEPEEKLEKEPAQPAPRPEMATHYDQRIGGTYKVTASDGLNVRTGPGTNRPILASLPMGTSVRNYGYYKPGTNGTKWLYIVGTVDGKNVEGYCSEKYLKK